MARMIDAVAWKMPLPAPAWLGELQDRDNVRPLLEAVQYQVASYSTGSAWFPTKWLANSVDRDRGIAEALFKETRCDVNTPMNDLRTDLSSVWRPRSATAPSVRPRRTRYACVRESRSKPARAAATAGGCLTGQRCGSAARSRPPRLIGRCRWCCT